MPVQAQVEIPHSSTVEFKKKTENPLERLEKTPIGYTLPDRYLNQVIHRKKQKLYNCFKQTKVLKASFLVDLNIASSGRVKARLIETTLTHKLALKCLFEVLNSIQFKKFLGPPLSKGYFFEFLKE